MKIKNYLKMLISGLILVLGHNHAMSMTPIEAVIPITEVYIPKGFDDNDRSEIVVEGYLPNLCYRYPIAKVNLKDQRIHVKVTSLFGQEENMLCAQMIIPFFLTVPLGVIEKGMYQILVNDSPMGEEKNLMTIGASTTNAIDENVYLAVNEVKKAEEKGEVVLKGFNPSDCFKLDSIQFISNDKNAYSVLPIMKQIREVCPMKMVPFEVKVKIPHDLHKEKVLLHVRSMSGNAVNTLFNFQD